MSRIGDLMEKVSPGSSASNRPPPRPQPSRPVAVAAPTRVQPAPAPAVDEQVPLLTALDRFVVHAYGFDRGSQADALVGRVGRTTDTYGNTAPRNIIRAANGTRTYVEMNGGFSSLESSMDLDPLGDRSGVSDHRYRQPWGTLKSEGVEMPEGGYNVLLLAEGRRTTRFYGDRKRAAPYVERARSGPWDMAVAWERGDGAPLAPVAVNGATKIYAARSVRGVIIARRAVIGQGGTIERFVTRTWLVKLDVMDSRGSRAEHRVRPEFIVETRVDETEVSPMTYADHIRPEAAQPLYRRAAAIFDAECAPGVPEAVSKPLTMFRTQNAKRSGPESYAFRDAIKDIGYMAALDKAQEPWQLAMVVGEYGYGSEFAPNPMSYTKGQTTAEMLRRYKEERPAARGQLIDRWMTDYVYPSESMWDYTGD